MKKKFANVFIFSVKEDNVGFEVLHILRLLQPTIGQEKARTTGCKKF